MNHGHDHQLDLLLLFKHLLHSQNGQDILATVISEITSYLYGIETKA